MADGVAEAARPASPASFPAPIAVARWLSPAIEPVNGGLAIAMPLVRMLVGVMWLFNTAWKVPPDFGQADESGLFVFTSYAVSHPVLPPYSWVVENLVLPQFVAFGWAVLAAETLLAVLLLSGAFIRVAAALGVAQSLAIGLSVAQAPNEWPWSYLLMIAVHLLILFGGAGRVLSVDALRAHRADGVALSRFWGVLATVMGLLAIVISAFGTPFGPSGVNLQLTGLEFGLGSYNVAGGIVLVVVGVAILAWSAVHAGAQRWLAWTAAGAAAAAAVLLTAQIGFSPPVLGGTAASAAFFVTLAVVATALARRSTTRRPNAGQLMSG